LRFTNDTRAFDYGLYVQNPGGKERSAYARFGDPLARSRMTLHAGKYSLKSRLCNWDQPDFTSVVVVVEDSNGEEVASTTFTPNVNIGGNTANSFGYGKRQTFEFDIPETGDYMLSYYTDAVKKADFVLGMCTLQVKSFSQTGIQDIGQGHAPSVKGCYDLSGRRIEESQLTNSQLQPGVYIIDGRKVVVK
jgi:hypothetical protein